jgi:hypothetical protein
MQDTKGVKRGGDENSRSAIQNSLNMESASTALPKKRGDEEAARANLGTGNRKNPIKLCVSDPDHRFTDHSKGWVLLGVAQGPESGVCRGSV